MTQEDIINTVTQNQKEDTVMKFKHLNHVKFTAEHMLQETYDVMGVEINLKEIGWRFTYDSAKRRFGLCNWSKKIISLSQPLCEMNLENGDQIKDTILHEIAHALDAVVFGRSSHGARWNRIATSIGCSGDRCYSSEAVVKPKSKYTLICPECGYEVSAHKMPKRSKSCGKCCSHYNDKYKFKIVQNY